MDSVCSGLHLYNVNMATIISREESPQNNVLSKIKANPTASESTFQCENICKGWTKMGGNHDEEGRKERTQLTLKSKQQENQPQHPQAELLGCHLVILSLLQPHSGAQTSARPEGRVGGDPDFLSWNWFAMVECGVPPPPHTHTRTHLLRLQTKPLLKVSTKRVSICVPG